MKLFVSLLMILYSILGSFLWITPDASARVPNFNDHFANKVMKNDKNQGEATWNFFDSNSSTIIYNRELSLMENIRNLFYPQDWQTGGQIWDLLKSLGAIIFVAVIVIQGIKYVMSADEPGEAQKLHVNIIYIFLGGLLFFSSTWILGTGLALQAGGGTTQLMQNIENNIVFQIFAGLRALAFFAAIIFLIYTGWKVMSAMDAEDKFSEGTRGIRNVVIALVLMKVIDYIYFIAQSPSFKNEATELIVTVSKTLGYVLGGVFTSALLYYGFRLLFGGTEEQLQKIKNVIVGIFLGSLVLFIFFLIVYQITQEFA